MRYEEKLNQLIKMRFCNDMLIVAVAVKPVYETAKENCATAPTDKGTAETKTIDILR